MKRVIKAASIDQERAMNCARSIKNKAQVLLNAMEDTPSGFLDANDLGQLYQELIDVLPALDFAINSRSVEYQKDEYGIMRRELDDMWEDE